RETRSGAERTKSRVALDLACGSRRSTASRGSTGRRTRDAHHLDEWWRPGMRMRSGDSLLRWSPPLRLRRLHELGSIDDGAECGVDGLRALEVGDELGVEEHGGERPSSALEVPAPLGLPPVV